MDNSFNKILFLTSFCCMSVDGEIAKEEFSLLEDLSNNDKLFGKISFKEEFSKCFNILKQIGTSFVSSYLDSVKQIEFTIEEKYKILMIAVKTIYADKKIDYSEIKFFKALTKFLDVPKEDVFQNVPDVEEYWLEEDLSPNTTDLDFLNNTDLSQIDINIDEK